MRAAIQEANALPGSKTINFNIGSGAVTITPLSALDPITEPVVIDGSTQPGFVATPIVEINGTSAGVGSGGLLLAAGSAGSTIRGFAINRFAQDGIMVRSNANTIVGNYVGTNAAGTAALGNGGSGIAIASASNTVGGTTAADRNVLSGNHGLAGVVVQYATATGNHIEGNYIGTDASGESAILNYFAGVQIIDSNDNIIGGTTAAARNVISGNGSGVHVSGSSTRDLVQGNYIGTDATGLTSLPNIFSGVELSASGNTVGGTSAGMRNVISGNGQFGISIDNVSIVATDNVVEGNYVGTDATGVGVLGNGAFGIMVSTNGNTIGGTAPGAGNIIAGNGIEGIYISGASGTVVQGNYIGLLANGSASNTANAGVEIFSHVTGPGAATGNTIGGRAVGARNVISGNAGVGVSMNLSSDSNTVQGNYIGTDASGMSARPNGGDGLSIQSASNMIGGSLPGEGNMISGNVASGIHFYSSYFGTGADQNVVQGNTIGLNAFGFPLPNTTHGVLINSGSSQTMLGGYGTGEGNVIAANIADGVHIDGASSSRNTVRANSIYANGAGIVLSSGGNASIGAPTITIAAPTSVSGTACASCQIDVFSDAAAQGRVYEGSTTASVAGIWSFIGPIIGPYATATATDASGNTSQFAAPLFVPRDHKTDANGDGYSAADEATIVNCGTFGCASIITFATSETPTCKDAGRNCGSPGAPADESVPARVAVPPADGYGCSVTLDLVPRLMTKNLAKSDVDLDGSVTILDLTKVASWFGDTINASPADPRWEGDMDGDGVITILDLAAMASNFGRSVANNCKVE